MAQYLDNPAGRLHKLLLDLHTAFPSDQQQKSVPAWQAIVTLIGNEGGLSGEAMIVSGVAALPQQVREGVAALPSDDDRKADLVQHLDEIENGMAALLNRQPLFQMFCIFSTNGEVPRSAAINSLAHCSYELHREVPEHTISDEEIARIIEMITELMQEVSEAQLPDQFKLLMLRHLHALLQAAHSVRFAGTQPLDDALFALMGAMVRVPSAQEELHRVGLGERFKNAVNTLNMLLSTGTAAAQLGQGIAGILGG
ncbi:hypothetical protein [Actinacidiphila oryziradicis]|uniref:Uncharacterized protein n=1 Tax=Actinacidiphila oryziradicis TaxID=2571141 RepID=A0A4U0RY29_9ACTN|nr:hypothetical protein [Actinacidiphila oryziradicis]TKA00497.1 hypothetical protein FCI23_42640 [Actinacidiphila oryziradicis]